MYIVKCASARKKRTKS